MTADIISILIHNNTLQSFVLSNQILQISMFPIFKTDYFHLWFLYKSDSWMDRLKKNERERNDVAGGPSSRTERNDFKNVRTCPALQ